MGDVIEPFLLERYFAEHEFATPYLLCSSDLETVAMRDLLATADAESAELWDDLRLGYTETTGHPLLRAELAALYDTVDADDVVTFAGASEAITCLVSGLVGRGDHVIATWPGYQSLYEVARSAGADVTTIELRAEAGWAIDLDAIRAALRPATRLIVVNAPHNPTGMLPAREVWSELADLAADAGATLPVRRGLPPAGARSRRPSRGRRRSGRPRRLGRRAVEELRPRRPAHRLAGDPQQRHPGGRDPREGLRLDVQRGAGRDPRRDRAARRGRDPDAQPGAGAATTSRWSTTSSTRHADRVCVAPAASGRDRVPAPARRRAGRRLLRAAARRAGRAAAARHGLRPRRGTTSASVSAGSTRRRRWTAWTPSCRRRSLIEMAASSVAISRRGRDVSWRSTSPASSRSSTSRWP